MNSATAMDLLDWQHRAVRIESPGPTWFNISGSGFVNYPDYLGDDSITWKNGYSSLFGLLLVKIPLMKHRADLKQLHFPNLGAAV